MTENRVVVPRGEGRWEGEMGKGGQPYGHDRNYSLGGEYSIMSTEVEI